MKVEQAELLKARALSSPVRVSILKLLKQKPHTLSEIARALSISKTNANSHLEKLRGAGLVSYENRSKWKYYRLSTEYSKVGLVQFSIPLVSLILSIAAILQAFQNTLPSVVSPDHEFSVFFGGFTALGFAFLLIGVFLFAFFLLSLALVARKLVR